MDARNLMTNDKNTWRIKWLVVWLIFGGLRSLAFAQPRQPDVILILTDDQGFGAAVADERTAGGEIQTGRNPRLC